MLDVGRQEIATMKRGVKRFQAFGVRRRQSFNPWTAVNVSVGESVIVKLKPGTAAARGELITRARLFFFLLRFSGPPKVVY